MQQQTQTHNVVIGNNAYTITHTISTIFDIYSYTQFNNHHMVVTYNNRVALRMLVVVNNRTAQHITTTPLQGFVDYSAVAPYKQMLITSALCGLITTYHQQ